MLMRSFWTLMPVVFAQSARTLSSACSDSLKYSLREIMVRVWPLNLSGGGGGIVPTTPDEEATALPLGAVVPAAVTLALGAVVPEAATLLAGRVAAAAALPAGLVATAAGAVVGAAPAVVEAAPVVGAA